MKNIILSLFEIFVYSSALILAVFAIKNVAQKKISAKFICLLWLVVLVRLVMPVTFDSPIHVNIPRPAVITIPAAEPLEENVVIDAPSASITDSVSDNSISSAISNTAAKNNALPTALPTIDFYLIALMIWAMGAFVFLTVSSVRIVTFKLKLKQLNMTDNYAVQLEAAKKELRIKREVRITISDHTDMPFVYGAIKPVIVIPKHFADNMSDAKLSYIIMHELCHVKRHDISMNLVWLLARAAHWFNPLTHIAYKSCLDSADKACDEMVSRNLLYEAKREYSQSLIDVMRHAKRNRTPALVLSFCRNKSTLGKRIENIIHPKKKSKIALVSMVLALCVIVFVCFTTACQPKNENIPRTVSSSNHSFDINDEEIIEKHNVIKNYDYLTENDLENVWQTVAEPCNDDKIIYILLEGEKTVFGILSSNNSLVSFVTKEVSLEKRPELSDEDYISIAEDYAKKVWKYDDVSVNTCENSILAISGNVSKYIVNLTGVMGDKMQPFEIELSGDGKLYSMRSYPYGFSNNNWLSKADCEKKASNYTKSSLGMKEDHNFNLIKAISFAPYAPIYIFDYEFTPEEESEAFYAKYDYKCHISISAITGEKDVVMIVPETNKAKDSVNAEVSGPTPTPIFRQSYHRGEPKQMTIYEGLAVIENLGLTPNATLSYEGYNDYFGDEAAIYKYYPNSESKGIVYTILSSDKSLASYYNSDCDMSFETNLSSDELITIAVDYVKIIWNAQNVDVYQFEDSSGGITAIGVGTYNKKNLVSKSSATYHYSYFYNISGVIKETNRPFHITLNGKGELQQIYCYPTDVDFEKGCTLEKAKEIAIELIKKEVHLTSIENLALISEELDTTYIPIHVLKYKYRSENPSYYNFDYDCEIQISATDGKRIIVRTTPITENIDVYQIDEAEQMAKEYIAQEKYGSSDMWDRLTTLRKGTMVDDYPDKPQITYSFNFLYSPKEETDKQDERSYTITVTAAGEFWDIGE